MNPIRKKLQSGQASIGCFLGLGSPHVAELLGYAGFDWLVIETEHSALGPAEIEHMLMAVSACPTVPMVRVPSSNKDAIQSALDMGARGIVVPMVKSVEEARAAVSATRYPPEGARGLGPLRASHYNYRRREYLASANEDIFVMLIVETREAWENLDEFLEIPGIDAFFLGSSDLGLALGMDLMDRDPVEMEKLENRFLEAGQKHGVILGGGAGDPEQLQKRLAQGFRFVGCSDHGLLVQAAAALLGDQP